MLAMSHVATANSNQVAVASDSRPRTLDDYEQSLRELAGEVYTLTITAIHAM